MRKEEDSQNRLVEDLEAVHDHLVVLVGDRLGDKIRELTRLQHSVDLQTQVTECREEVILIASLHVVCVGEGQVQCSDQIWILVDNLQNVVCRESFGAKTTLQLREKFSMYAVVCVEEGGECGVFGSCANLVSWQFL